MPANSRPMDLQRNLDASYQWLCAAQDATPDGGVAGCYNLVRGWGTSYPETTGYIIPTFLHYAGVMRQPDAGVRAIRMADWEVEVQLRNGAVRSGTLDTEVSPAVFNTGQVLFGWVSAFVTAGDQRYARSATRASEWLISMQDSDGAWRKQLSLLTTSSVQSYNVRSAWGLALAGKELHEQRWIKAAIKNCDWALTQQLDSGWFRSNTFRDDEAALLHTIGYMLEGLLGVGHLLDREQYVQAVINGVTPLVQIYRNQRVLKGRYDAHWRPVVSWRCLTGEAQISLVLLRLANITGTRDYVTTARALLEDVARLQDVDSPHVESHGSVSGSYPIWGDYGPFNYLNWAAKFLIDALLLELHGVDVQTWPSWTPHEKSA